MGFLVFLLGGIRKGVARKGAGERRKKSQFDRSRAQVEKVFVRVCVDITPRAAWLAGGANLVQV